MKYCRLPWAPTLLLTTCIYEASGCVPVSIDEYAAGRAPGSESDGSSAPVDPAGSQRDAALEDATVLRDASDKLDAAIVPSEAMPVDASAADAQSGDGPARDADVGLTADASSVPRDAGVGDAGRIDAVDAGWRQLCADPGVLLCDDFDGPPLSCPLFELGPWTSCERLYNAPDPVLLAQPAPHNRVLYSTAGGGPGSSRVARVVPGDLGQFHAEFDLFLQPSNNRLFTIVKLEEEAGRNAEGVASHYVGVSLVAGEGNLLLVVQTAGDLSKPAEDTVVAVRPLPRAWTRVQMDVAYDAQIHVTLRFDDQPAKSFPPVARGSATIEHTAFLLGVYSDLEGDAAALYDNVVVSARPR